MSFTRYYLHLDLKLYHSLSYLFAATKQAAEGRSSQNEYPHKSSRMGYANLIEKMVSSGELKGDKKMMKI